MSEEKKDKKACCSTEKGGCCCKFTKFLPHNWFGFKSLYVIFVACFYIALAYMIYQFGLVAYYYKIGRFQGIGQVVDVLISILLNVGVATLLSVTFAKMLKALCKIKRAVAPCCKEEKKSK